MANNSVIAGVYDFSLSYNTCKRLDYQDYSEWMTGGQFAPPVTYLITVKTPACDEREVEVHAQGPTRITPQQLGFSDCIPSGIYTFTAEACEGVGGKGYSKKVGIFCEEECALQQAQSRLKPGEDNADVLRISEYLVRAKLAAELDNESLALEYMGIIRDELRRLNCHCKCN